MYHVLLPIDIEGDRARSQVALLESLPIDADEITATVLHVYESVDAPADEAGSAVIDEINESIEELRGVPDSVELVAARLDELGITNDRVLHVGDPAEAIQSVARDRDVDAIVLGMRKRSPVGKALFGSVSQTVLLNTDRPVIVGKPDDGDDA
jgi:nucleotide-binding universal stress UspA family protein